MPRIFAIANQKGGVGKTTVALGLAAVAARRDLSVVVVDLDPQANATSGMGVWSPVSTVAHGLAADADGALIDVVAATGWGPDLFDVPPRLAPSSPDLAQLEPQMAVDPIGAQDRLRRALIGVDADLVIIDCPPSLGVLTLNGLTAADEVIVPLQCETLSHRGVGQLMETIADVQRLTNPGLEIVGVVPTLFDGRTTHAKAVLADLGPRYGVRVFTPISRSIRFAEAPAAGRSILATSRASKGARDYRRLADELNESLALRD